MPVFHRAESPEHLSLLGFPVTSSCAVWYLLTSGHESSYNVDVCALWAGDLDFSSKLPVDLGKVLFQSVLCCPALKPTTCLHMPPSISCDCLLQGFLLPDSGWLSCMCTQVCPETRPQQPSAEFCCPYLVVTLCASSSSGMCSVFCKCLKPLFCGSLTWSLSSCIQLPPLDPSASLCLAQAQAWVLRWVLLRGLSGLLIRSGPKGSYTLCFLSMRPFSSVAHWYAFSGRLAHKTSDTSSVHLAWKINENPGMAKDSRKVKILHNLCFLHVCIIYVNICLHVHTHRSSCVWRYMCISVYVCEYICMLCTCMFTYVDSHVCVYMYISLGGCM